MRERVFFLLFFFIFSSIPLFSSPKKFIHLTADNQLQLFIKDEGDSLNYSFTRNHFKKDSGFILLFGTQGKRN